MTERQDHEWAGQGSKRKTTDDDDTTTNPSNNPRMTNGCASSPTTSQEHAVVIQDARTAPGRDDEHSARALVLGTTELLEAILAALPPRDNLLVQGTCRSFKTCYENSRVLQLMTGKRCLSPPKGLFAHSSNSLLLDPNICGPRIQADKGLHYHPLFLENHLPGIKQADLSWSCDLRAMGFLDNDSDDKSSATDDNEDTKEDDKSEGDVTQIGDLPDGQEFVLIISFDQDVHIDKIGGSGSWRQLYLTDIAVPLSLIVHQAHVSTRFSSRKGHARVLNNFAEVRMKTCTLGEVLDVAKHCERQMRQQLKTNKHDPKFWAYKRRVAWKKLYGDEDPLAAVVEGKAMFKEDVSEQPELTVHTVRSMMQKMFKEYEESGR